MSKMNSASPGSAGSAKPKFQARRSVVTESRLREIAAFAGNPIPHSDYHLILEDMVNMSIRRHGRPLPMLKLQGEILTDLIETEETVSQYKKKLSELKQDKASEDDISHVETELFKYRRLRYALRDIGDGIAWRFLEFDRCALSQMGIRARKQHINKEGTVQELHELADVINKNDKVAILNDITHILKKGDITAKLPDGSFEFVEVKSSNTKSSRLIRQKRDLQETITFLNEGQKIDEGQLIRILTLQLEPQSYMRNFEKLLMRAESDCVLTEKIGDHLVLQVTDFSAARTETDPEPSFKKRNEILDNWTENGDMIIEFSTVDRYAHVQNFTPFSIFPIQHRLRVKLMTGAILVGTSLNVSAVLRYLAGRGWAQVKGPNELAKEAEGNGSEEIPVAALKKGALTLHLPMPMLGRLGHEFLSVKTL